MKCEILWKKILNKLAHTCHFNFISHIWCFSYDLVNPLAWHTFYRVLKIALLTQFVAMALRVGIRQFGRGCYKVLTDGLMDLPISSSLRLFVIHPAELSCPVPK